MVVQIPEIDQTPWGKELKERGRVEGRAEGRAEGLRTQMKRLQQQLETFEQMFQAAELPEAAYTRLKDQANAELQNVQAELARLSNGAQTAN